MSNMQQYVDELEQISMKLLSLSSKIAPRTSGVNEIEEQKLASMYSRIFTLSQDAFKVVNYCNSVIENRLDNTEELSEPNMGSR